MKVGYKIIGVKGPITKTHAAFKGLKKTCVRYFQKNDSGKAKCIKRYLLLVHDKFVFKSFNKLYTLVTTNQIKIKLKIQMYNYINVYKYQCLILSKRKNLIKFYT